MNNNCYQYKEKINQESRVFIIAEVGINHNGDVNIAKKMIEAAKECGADAVKFQTFKAEEFVSDPLQTYTYTSQGEKITESMLEMFKRYEFSETEWREIIEHCKKIQIQFLTTPQNYSDLEIILAISDIPIIKVGSDDLTNLPLLKKYAAKNIPMIISAGMSYLEEIKEAVECIREEGNNDIIVLHCISSYPAELEEVNMNKMMTIGSQLGVRVGFSDHTRGIQSAIVATALGAKVIEKHFTLDKDMVGPDHWFSSDVDELKSLIMAIRSTEVILGNEQVKPTQKEMEMRNIARRSIIANVNIKKGDVINEDMITFKRPGIGLPPKEAVNIIGYRAKKNLEKGKLLSLEDIL